MKPIKVFLKNINVLNLLLLLIAIFLFFEWNYPLIDERVKIVISKPKEILIKNDEEVVVENATSSLDYVVIAEKNLFHPERKMPSEKKEDQQSAGPEIILYGTLVTDEQRIAYIEDKKAPYSTQGRGKRQVAVNEGSMIAGYKLTEVNTESILLIRGEDRIVVTLRTQKERKPGEAAGRIISPGFAPGSASGRIPPLLQPKGRSAQLLPPPVRPAPGKVN
ncbi:MAG: hypothetical protein A4E71_01682 [Smithella sp. PtaU1.Bin162]|nr:MAG: hypothetical protein A4E71_01682 [Smithella sp. PtaU1.Bin162]